MTENSRNDVHLATETVSRSRREFLERAGKLAAYTPPTMLALMYPGAHAIASGGGHPSDKGTGHGSHTHSGGSTKKSHSTGSIKQKLKRKAAAGEKYRTKTVVKNKFASNAKRKQVASVDTKYRDLENSNPSWLDPIRRGRASASRKNSSPWSR